MSNNYDAVYSATSVAMRGDYQGAITRAAVEAFDISWIKTRANEAIDWIRSDLTAPHVLMRPRLSIDGNRWRALYGDNLQDGVAGFGDTPALACASFDAEWHKRLPAKEPTHAR